MTIKCSRIVSCTVVKTNTSKFLYFLRTFLGSLIASQMKALIKWQLIQRTNHFLSSRQTHCISKKSNLRMWPLSNSILGRKFLRVKEEKVVSNNHKEMKFSLKNSRNHKSPTSSYINKNLYNQILLHHEKLMMI